jgi:SAM-dependent methyltransferase
MFAPRVGMDFSESALERAKEHADEVIVGSVDSLEPHRRFDVIVGISLIEHVYEPMGFMGGLVSHLEENGRIVMVTPDFDGVWRLALGQRWPSFKIPEHVLFYNRRSLRLLGDMCGLETRFFYFTQFAPLWLIFASLDLDRLVSPKMADLHLPLPCTMLGAVFSRRSNGS